MVQPTAIGDAQILVATSLFPQIATPIVNCALGGSVRHRGDASEVLASQGHRARPVASCVSMSHWTEPHLNPANLYCYTGWAKPLSP
jgi:hypothetical protein